MGRAMNDALSRLGFQVHPYDRSGCDIRSLDALLECTRGLGPGDVVVNAAAWTDVKAAEQEPGEAFEANVLGSMNIAIAAKRAGAACIYFSTDYVFDGRKESAYVESDPPNPLNAYGGTKLAGEALTCSIAPQHYVARVATVFGRAPGRQRLNFVDKLLTTAPGAKVELQSEGSISPTYASDAAELTGQLLAKQAPYGVYHLSNAGACTWYELGAEVRASCGLDIIVARADTSPSADIRRPLYSALASERLAVVGISPKPWRDGLRRYLQLAGRLRT